MSRGGITCRDLVGRLSLYLDGELRPRMVQEMEQHLEQCDDCRHCADEIKATIDLIRDRAYEPLPSSERVRMRDELWRTLRGSSAE